MRLLPRSSSWLAVATCLALVLGACTDDNGDNRPDVADAATADAADDAEEDVAEDILKPPALTCSIKASPLAGNAPLPVDLTTTFAGIDNRDVFVKWKFGDGSNEQTYDLTKAEEAGGDHVTHTYQNKGTYTVTAVVSWRPNSKFKCETIATVTVKDPASLSLGAVELLSSPTVGIGSDVTLTYGVTNDGDTVEVPFETDIYLSVSDTVDDSAVKVATITEPGIAAGTTIEYVNPKDEKGNPLPRKPNQRKAVSFKVPQLPDAEYFVLVVVDPAKKLNELNRVDNVGYASSQVRIDTKVTAKPDLVITAPIFDTAKEYSQGDALAYEHQVANLALGEAKASKFAVFLSADDKIDYNYDLAEVCKTNDKGEKYDCVENPAQVDKMLTKLGNSTLQKIAPNAQLPLFYAAVLPEVKDGDYFLIAAIDVKNAVDETNEGNNTAVSTDKVKIKKVIKQGVDVDLVSMTVKPKGTFLGSKVSVEWKVKNSGTMALAQPTPASVFFCPTKAFSKGTCIINQTNFTVPPLASGEEKTGAQEVPISTNTPVQKWFVYLRVDPDDKLQELDESNNVGLFENLIVTAQANVDLWPEQVGFHPGTAAAGSTVKISYTVHNDGTTGSASSMTYIALTPNGNCSASAVQTGQAVLVKKVAAGGIDGLSTVDVTDTIVLPLGLDHKVTEYQLCVVLDAENANTKETNKGNNAAISQAKLKVEGPKGGCFEDDEDSNGANNDTLAKAVPLPAGNPPPQLGSCGNEDWWKVSVPPGHSLFVTLETTAPLWTTPVPSDLDLEIYAPDAKTLLDAQKLAGPIKQGTALTVLQGGDHFLRVYPHFKGNMAHYTLKVLVQAPVQGVDLLATALSVGPAATFPGGLVKSKLKVTNLGDKAAGAFVLRYLLSKDMVIDSKDTLVKNVTFDKGVAPATTIEASDTLILPQIAGGLYYVGAVLDISGAVTETNEKNNAIASNQISLHSQVACASDSYSGNHTVDDAATLATTSATYPKLNVCPGLEDWFAIDVPQGKAFSVRAKWTYQPGKGLLGVQVVDASKSGIVAGSANPQNTLAVLPYVQTGGTYYVHTYVLPEGGSALPHDYDLEVKITEPDATDVCLADYYESNNSSKSGQELGCGLANLTLCLGDEDWFHLDMVKDEQIVLEFNHPGSAFQLKVFANPNLPPVASLSGNGKLTFKAPAEGTYHMQVSYKSAGVKPAQGFAYSLKVDGGKGVDLMAKIQSVFPGQIIQGEDVYMTVKLSNECKDNAGPFEYGYYLSTDNKLDASDKLLSLKATQGLMGKTSIDVDDKAIIPVDAKPGPAFVLVAADATNTVAESQELNNADAAAIEVIKLCIADVLEPNGAPQIAIPLPPGRTPDLSLCPYDLDWYSVDLKKGETLTVTLEFEQAKGDLDVRLYKVAKFGNPVAVSATKKAPEQFTYTADEATKYYVRVSGFTGDSNAYSLVSCKSMTGKCVECTDNSVCGPTQECDLKTTVCGAKFCSPSNLAPCNDGNSCTADQCSSESKCVNVTLAGDVCSDGDVCTLGEACNLQAMCVVPASTVVTGLPSQATGTDLGADVTAAADGGYVLAGTRQAGLAGLQGYLAAYDKDGKLKWQNLFVEGAGNCQLHAVTVVPGEILAVGAAAVPGKGGVLGAWFLRVSQADGSVIVSKLIEVGGLSASMRALVALPDGSVVAVGSAYDAGQPGNGQDGWATLLDSDGNPLWSSFVGGTGNDVLLGVAALPNGEVAAVGADEGTGGQLKGLFVRFSTADGTTLASATVTKDTAQASLQTLIVDKDGLLRAGGATDAGQPAQSPPAWQAAVFQLEPDGKVGAVTVYPATTPQAPAYLGVKTSAIYDLALRPDGGLIAAGTTGALGEKSAVTDAVLWSIGPDGVLAETWTFGKAGKDAAKGVIAWANGWLGYGTLSEGDLLSDALWLRVLPPKLDCDDLNPCTADTCDVTKGCGHAPVADGTACGTAASCQAGVCK